MGDFVTALNQQNSTQAQRVKSLVKNLNDASYVANGQITQYGNKPVVIYADAASLSQLNQAGAIQQSVELLTININAPSDLSQTLNLAFLADNPQIKYIHLLSKIAASPAALTGLIQGNNLLIPVFYTQTATK